MLLMLMKGLYWLRFGTLKATSNDDKSTKCLFFSLMNYIMKAAFFLLVIMVSCHSNEKTATVEEAYYEDGTLAAEIPYVGTRREGEAKMYYYNGRLKSKVYYSNDLVHGDFISYDSTGNVWTKGYYYKGKAVGPLYYYTNNKLLLYNERDFDGNVYYVLKYDSVTGRLIKEEGVAMSPHTRIDSTEGINKYELLFCYAEPEIYKNSITVLFNSQPVSFERQTGHVGRFVFSCTKYDTVQIKVKAELRGDRYINIRDSVQISFTPKSSGKIY
jgi:hypothetical protein